MIFLLYYALLAGSFSLSSYFFIHLPAIRQSSQKNDIVYSIAYILSAFVLFPPLLYGWATNRELLIKELYNGIISI